MKHHIPIRLLAVRIVAVLTAIMGLVNLLSATIPALHSRAVMLRAILPLEVQVQVRHSAHLTAALAGFALLVVAFGLWRRKKVAWVITLALLVVTAVSHLVKGLDWEEATGALLLAGVLIALRRSFVAQSDRPSVGQGIRVTIIAFLFTLAYGVAGFYLLDRHFREDFGCVSATEQTVAMFTEFDDPGLQPVTRFGRWFADSIYFVAAGTFGFALFALLRPVVLNRSAITAADRELAKQIIEAHGKSSIARFNLFDDKSYLFTERGSVVAFGVAGRACVALGDPIGPEEDAAGAIRAFRVRCEQNDWTPAFFQTLPDLLPLYKEAGFRALPIGSEAVVVLEDFTLSGKPSKSLRGSVGRLEREGITGTVLLPPHPPEIMHQLREISEEWLLEQKGAEKRFSLGWHDEAYLQDGPVAVIRGADGMIWAFANVISEYQARESTIDLMRRRADAPNGVMDLMFVTLFEWAKSEGYKTFNLGLSPLAGVGDAPDDPAMERAVAFLREHFRQFYSFDGLRNFKEKFRPRWEPRYLLYAHETDLPRVALAIVQLDNGDAPLWRYVFPARSPAAKPSTREPQAPSESSESV